MGGDLQLSPAFIIFQCYSFGKVGSICVFFHLRKQNKTLELANPTMSHIFVDRSKHASPKSQVCHKGIPMHHHHGGSVENTCNAIKLLIATGVIIMAQT